MQIQFGHFEIDDDPQRLDIDSIYKYLTQSYWSKGITKKAVEKSLKHSICFGIYLSEQQIGFARVVTDYIKFAFLADVFILSDYQNRGLGKKLVQTVLNYEDFKTVRKWLLYTKDAHGLYQKFDFQSPAQPEYILEKIQADWLKIIE